jgi:uncharacterized membrane protein (DUF2068 family)
VSEIVEGVSPRAAGVRLIVAYKLTKALVFMALAVVITTLALSGYIDKAYELAHTMRDHLVNHWAVKLAAFLMRWLTMARIWWVVAALAGDAIVSAIEGLALARGYAWAAWLVVAATSLLLPVEVIEIAYRTTLARVAIFAINLGIVLYLLRRAMREHHEAHPHAPARSGR